MIFKLLAILGLSLISLTELYAQSQCTTLGQTPATAFPVCGVSTFNQSTVPLCGGTRIPGPCTNDGVTDINPFWYKFTCFRAGNLGFTVTPIDLNDDYDWQLFDVTNKNPNDVFTDASMFVACNWSGLTGVTGASGNGSSLQNCAGTGFPLFSSRPSLIQGHQYLLLLSNFSASQKGYNLSFGGGTADITDPQQPKTVRASANCSGLKVSVKLNKKMKCATLAADGSDFSLFPANASITSAVALGCNSSFDMDSVELTLTAPLPPATYTLTVKNGMDGNTILDNCNEGVTVGETMNFTIFPLAPTPMDSLRRVGCEPTTLELIFRKPIDCTSIAADGSDFVVSGPSAVVVTGASGICSNGKTTVITVTLSRPIQVGGNYQITLQSGTDGNTIFDECSQATPAGSAINFPVSGIVLAAFTQQIQYGCKTDTIFLSHNGNGGTTSWAWYSNGQFFSNQQNPTIFYTVFGQKQIALKVSNGVCSDSATVQFNLDNGVKAAFDFTDVVCPEDFAVFSDKSVGNIASWSWNFGNGNTSTDQQPTPQKYTPPTTTRERFYSARLIVQGGSNCSDTIVHRIKAVNTCFVAVPNAFSPNNDGHNEYLYPLNAYKAENLIFRVFNRYGQVVFETKDWTKKWDGTLGGRPQPSGTYVWTLQYIDRDTRQAISKRGVTVIVR
ncbi:MAG: gliding motility-associated C-terminal domain-containing protein [Chitinophagaceae bacterium]|nr:gliding motility-associated C-terminal domain-containing protein [Chitinophagaceae bacterium]